MPVLAMPSCAHFAVCVLNAPKQHAPPVRVHLLGPPVFIPTHFVPTKYTGHRRKTWHCSKAADGGGECVWCTADFERRVQHYAPCLSYARGDDEPNGGMIYRPAVLCIPDGAFRRTAVRLGPHRGRYFQVYRDEEGIQFATDGAEPPPCESFDVVAVLNRVLEPCVEHDMAAAAAMRHVSSSYVRPARRIIAPAAAPAASPATLPPEQLAEARQRLQAERSKRPSMTPAAELAVEAAARRLREKREALDGPVNLGDVLPQLGRKDGAA